jgi:hypothetical protein
MGTPNSYERFVKDKFTSTMGRIYRIEDLLSVRPVEPIEIRPK